MAPSRVYKANYLGDGIVTSGLSNSKQLKNKTPSQDLLGCDTMYYPPTNRTRGTTEVRQYVLCKLRTSASLSYNS
jgi:hypothetical protein